MAFCGNASFGGCQAASWLWTPRGDGRLGQGVVTAARGWLSALLVCWDGAAGCASAGSVHCHWCSEGFVEVGPILFWLNVS